MKGYVSYSTTHLRVPDPIPVAAAVPVPTAQGSYLFRLLIFSLAFILLAQPARSENEPTFRGNTEHSGVYEAVGVPQFSQVKWYVGSTAGTLSAVDLNTRQMAWTFTTDESKENGAALTKKDGTSGYFDAFRGLNYLDTVADYSKLDGIGPLLSSPVVVDNVVYVGSVDGNLYALM